MQTPCTVISEDPAKAEAAQKEEGAVSILPKIIKTAFTLVNLIYFFTSGPDEVGLNTSVA